MVAKTVDPAIGDRFGRLVVKDGIPIRKNREKYFTLICDCGNEKVIAKGNLLSGRSSSCGCYNSEVTSKRSTKHGKSHTQIHAIWNMMKQRCNLPTNKQYKEYGGRGIKVSDDWLVFENFYRDMGDVPFKGASLERRDNNGNYCKENVYWASRTEQANNKRNSVRFNLNGESLSLGQIAKRFDMNINTLNSRVYGQGLSISEAISKPKMSVGTTGKGYKGRSDGEKLYKPEDSIKLVDSNQPQE